MEARRNQMNGSRTNLLSSFGSLVVVQVVASVFGYTLDLRELGNGLLAVVNALFAVLTILGSDTDPTTAGVADSQLALTYAKPKPKEKA